jgi:hypothetical protein
MIPHQLMIRQKKCTAIFIRSVVVRILFVISLIILCDQPTHDADVTGPCPGKFLPLFIEIILIPAKIVTIITLGFELHNVPSAQQQTASFSNAPLIMAGHLELMVSGINAAKDCPQKILSHQIKNDKTVWTYLTDLWRCHHH